MGRFKADCFLVTGGASGIGAATCKTIIDGGGKVLIADLQADAGQQVADELGANALFKQTDVTSEQDIIDAIATAESELGPLTGLVNSAGIIGVIGPISETPVEEYDRTMAILTRSVFLGIKHASRVMKPRGKGTVVSLASTAGILGGQGPHIYTMAKHAVIGLTKSAASELSSFGIRINTVAPGGTVSPMTSALTGGDEKMITEAIASASPLGIACQPEDIANGIAYLLSDEARYITGHTLVIDAGVTTSNLQTTFHSDEAATLLHAGQRDTVK